jgi:predicted MPP superfamily phosphohydrolase
MRNVPTAAELWLAAKKQVASWGFRQWLKALGWLTLVCVLLALAGSFGAITRDRIENGSRGSASTFFLVGRGFLFSFIFGISALYADRKLVTGTFAQPFCSRRARRLSKGGAPSAGAGAGAGAAVAGSSGVAATILERIAQWTPPAVAWARVALWVIAVLAMIAVLTAWGPLFAWTPLYPDQQVDAPPTIVTAGYVCFGFMIQLLFFSMIVHIVTIAQYFLAPLYHCLRRYRVQQRAPLDSTAAALPSTRVAAVVPSEAEREDSTEESAPFDAEKGYTVATPVHAHAAVPLVSDIEGATGSSDSGVMAAPPTWYRRKFHSALTCCCAPAPFPLAATALFVAMVCSIAGAYGALSHPDVVFVPLKLARLPSSLDGFRIGVLTDLHIGPVVGKDTLQYAVDTVLAQQPDIVVLVGDILEGDQDVFGAAVEPLRQLALACPASNASVVTGSQQPRPCRGVFFVSGNHDPDAGIYEDKLAFFRSMGIVVMQNDRISVPLYASGSNADSLDLVGVPDFATSRTFGTPHDMRKAVEGRDTSRELVVLAHQPRHAADAGAVGTGLMIAGHVHAGQMPPVMLASWAANPYFQHPRDETDASNPQNMLVYVSGGTAQWGPLSRIAAPHEITLIELSRGTQQGV